MYSRDILVTNFALVFDRLFWDKLIFRELHL